MSDPEWKPVASLYGFYSEEALETCGGVYWSTPDGGEALETCGGVYWSTPDGGEVLVTCVCRTAEGDGYQFADKVAVGVVVEYMRQHPFQPIVKLNKPAAIPTPPKPEDSREWTRKEAEWKAGQLKKAGESRDAEAYRKMEEERRRKPPEGIGTVKPISGRVGMLL